MFRTKKRKKTRIDCVNEIKRDIRALMSGWTKNYEWLGEQVWSISETKKKIRKLEVNKADLDILIDYLSEIKFLGFPLFISSEFLYPDCYLTVYQNYIKWSCGGFVKDKIIRDLKKTSKKSEFFSDPIIFTRQVYLVTCFCLQAQRKWLEYLLEKIYGGNYEN